MAHKWLPAALAAFALSAVPAAAKDDRPNILVIVADDLGYSDLGSFGGEIATPHLDQLANAGTRLTNFHAAPACSPTRAMFLTGADSHKVGLGAFYEVPKNAKPSGPGYEGFLTQRYTVATALRAVGYHTLMSGKWHLGLEAEQSPAARGFDWSYALLQGVANHYGLDQKGSTLAPAGHASYRENGVSVRYPEGKYSTDLFTDKLLEYLESTKGDDRPFLAYLAYTAPHSPLQAPPETISKYKGRYDAGYGVLLAERLARLKRLGLIAPDTVAPPLEGRRWADLTAAERATSARIMEVYAAMVDKMDENVGRVVRWLKQNGEFDNTIIIFLSDNGADGHAVPEPRRSEIERMSGEGGPYNNGYENIGRPNSYVKYGHEWAAAASAPFRLYKGYTTEGGIRTTAFISGKGVASGRISHSFSHVTDLAPTLLQLAGASMPAADGGEKLAPLQGNSLLALMRDPAARIHGESARHGWELGSQKALRQGDWKVTYVLNRATKQGNWALYDLRSDPGETTDLSTRHPSRFRSMIKAWHDYARENGVKPFPGETWSDVGQSGR